MALTIMLYENACELCSKFDNYAIREKTGTTVAFCRGQLCGLLLGSQVLKERTNEACVRVTLLSDELFDGIREGMTGIEFAECFLNSIGFTISD